MANPKKKTIPPLQWVSSGVIETAMEYLRRGHSQRYAWEQAGASYRTAHQHVWRARRGEETPLLPYLPTYEEAIFEGLDTALDRIVEDDVAALDSKDGLVLQEKREVIDKEGCLRTVRKWVSPKDRLVRSIQTRAALRPIAGVKPKYLDMQQDRRILRDPSEFIYALGERDTIEDVLSGVVEHANAPTPQQAAILKDVAEWDRVAVHSANSMGKSHLLVRLAVWNLLKPGSTTIVTAPEARIIKTGLMPRVNALAASIGIGGRLKQSIRPNPADDEWQLQAWSSDTAEGSSGLHPSGPFLIICDEAQGMSETLMSAIEGMASGRGNKILLLGNGLYLDGPFFDACMDGSGTWRVHRLSALEHPNCLHDRMIYRDAIDRQWVEQRRIEWGENSDNWRSRVLGLFPQVDPKGVHFLTQEQIDKMATPAGAPDWFDEQGVEV